MRKNPVLSITAYGNNREELEANALIAGRVFFGEDAEVRIKPGYSASQNYSILEEPNKTFYASVYVTTGDPDEEEEELETSQEKQPL